MGQKVSCVFCLHALSLIMCVSQAQPPALTQEGIRNAASHIPTSLRGGSLAPGERFVIRGIRLQQPGTATRVFLETAAARTEAEVLTSSDIELEVRVPGKIPFGPAHLTVQAGQLVSRPSEVILAPSSFGIYTGNKRGWGLGDIRNVNADGSRSPNALDSTALPGEFAELRGTGLGEAVPELFIGNKRSRVDRFERGRDGYDTIRFQVPLDAPPGCFVPVLARTANNHASNTVTMAISADSSLCREEPNWVLRALDPNPTSAVLLPLRGRFRLNPERRGPKESFNIDRLLGGFYRPIHPPSITLAHLLPPPGACTAYTTTFAAGGWQEEFLSTLLGNAVEKPASSADRLILSGEGQTAVATPYKKANTYQARLAETGTRGFKPFLVAGSYSITAGDAELFAAHFRIGPEFTWTNRDKVRVIDRSRALKLEWRAQPGETFLAVGFNVDADATGMAICLCSAARGAHSITIPAMMLANFPATRDVPGLPLSMIGLLSYPATENSFQLGGGARGVVFPALFIGQSVKYR